MALEQELDSKLRDIGRVFDVNKILSLEPDEDYVKRYYRVNKLPYSLFHTGSDLIYMGISGDGTFKESDLLGQAYIVEEHIRKIGAKRVLELATGRGANSLYLARKFPSVAFDGIDISSSQLGFAAKKAKKAANYVPVLGDYHDLSRYEDGSFDLVFEVEAVCYSARKDAVFAEACRVLKKGGLLVMFDGYLAKKRDAMSDSQITACGLVEKGMAVRQFELYRSFVGEAGRAHFELVGEEDLSRRVLPTMERFERLSARFFRHEFLARIVAKLVPKKFAYNAVSGYLMPTAMKMGLFCYMQTVLRKAE